MNLIKDTEIGNAAHLKEWLGLVLPVNDKLVPKHFQIDNQSFGSVEAFSLVILLPKEDSRRSSFALLDPESATTMRAQLKSEGLTRPEFIHWKGKDISFRSEEHVQLMRRVASSFQESNPDWQTHYLDRVRIDRPVQGMRFARQLPDRSEFVFNIGVDPEVALLSNFAATPFTMGSKLFASVEAFVQYIKYPYGAPHKEEIPELVGKYAKRRGKLANNIIEMVSDRQNGSFEGLYVYWENDRIPYRSNAHIELIQNAIERKFASNNEAREQLIQTGQKTLIHNLGYPESRYTSLPAVDFCRVLTTLRDRYTSAY